MTANQIFFMGLTLALIAGVCILWLRVWRGSRARPTKTHGPNPPDVGHDQGAIARSAQSGHTGGGDGNG